MSSRRLPPLFGKDDPPFFGGASEPGSETLGRHRWRIRSYPRSLFAQLLYARRVRAGTLSEAEREHLEGQVAASAGRDLGSRANELVGDDGVIRVDPPHRGVGALLFAASLRSLTRGLSQAITHAIRGAETVERAERKARTLREDVEAARRQAPPVHEESRFPMPLWLAMIGSFAAIEGFVSKPLWDWVLQDRRLGTVFALVFAVVFAGIAHVLAIWLWSFATRMRWLRHVTALLVVGLAVSAAGLLVVAGLERDRVLIGDRAAKLAAERARAEGTAAAQAAIAQGMQGGASGAPAAGAAGSGLLGALGTGQATPAMPAASTPVPGAMATTMGNLPARGETGKSSVSSPDDVSFTFVVWLNFAVLFAMVLFTRAHRLGLAPRMYELRMRKLEAAHRQAVEELGRAEARRQDDNILLDYARRVLEPEARRCTRIEHRLDGVFVDQLRRAALMAGHGWLTVELLSEPPEHDEMVAEVVEAEIRPLTAAHIELPPTAVDPERVSAEAAGGRQVPDDPPAPQPTPYDGPEPPPTHSQAQPAGDHPEDPPAAPDDDVEPGAEGAPPARPAAPSGGNRPRDVDPAPAADARSPLPVHEGKPLWPEERRPASAGAAWTDDTTPIGQVTWPRDKE